MFNLFKKDDRIPVYFRNHNSVLNNILPFFRSVKPEKARAFVLWADSFGPAREMAEYGKKLGKPVIVVQHGRGSVREYLPPLNYSPVADKLCVWGPRDEAMLKSIGIIKDRIVLTGAPIFDGISRDKENHECINVLFAPIHWDSEVDENHEIYKKLASIKGINVTTKLLRKSHDASKYGRNIVVTTQKDPDLLDKIFTLMRKTDVVVTNGSGTFELIAMYLNIPVIFIDNFKPRPFMDTSKEAMAEFMDKYGKPKAVDCTKDMNDLPELIRQNVENPGKLKAEREKELYDCAAIGLLNKPAQNIKNVILGAINNEKNIIIE